MKTIIKIVVALMLLVASVNAGRAVFNNYRFEDAVHESLSLCLACKACKAECPTHVDMASYKAEFMAHYYEGKRRPLHAYAFGLIHTWSRLASLSARSWPGSASREGRDPGGDRRPSRWDRGRSSPATPGGALRLTCSGCVGSASTMTLAPRFRSLRCISPA